MALDQSALLDLLAQLKLTDVTDRIRLNARAHRVRKGLIMSISQTPLATPLAATAETGKFLGVNWAAFGVVFVVAFVAAVLIVCVFAVPLRLLAVGSDDDTGSEGSIVSTARGERPLGATVGAFACLFVCAAAVLYGLYMIIPQFH